MTHLPIYFYKKFGSGDIPLLKTSVILPSHIIVQSGIINIHVYKNVSAYSVNFFRWSPLYVLAAATTLEMVKRLLLAPASWTVIISVFDSTCIYRKTIVLFCAELTGRAKEKYLLFIYLFLKLEQLPVMYNFNSRKSNSHPTLHWLCHSTKLSLRSQLLIFHSWITLWSMFPSVTCPYWCKCNQTADVKWQRIFYTDICAVRTHFVRIF